MPRFDEILDKEKFINQQVSDDQDQNNIDDSLDQMCDQKLFNIKNRPKPIDVH